MVTNNWISAKENIRLDIVSCPSNIINLYVALYHIKALVLNYYQIYIGNI